MELIIVFTLGWVMGATVTYLTCASKARNLKNQLDIVNRKNINIAAKLMRLTDRDAKGRFVNREKRGW